MPRAYRKPSDMPAEIPVFPLGGALLFAHATLPLNIFEPRYLSMVDAALAGDRLIGMIQPAGLGTTDEETPQLAGVGCAGRITGFQETEDGHYLIVLTGISRFRVAAETTPAGNAFRTVRADWFAFAADRSREEHVSEALRLELVGALKDYLERNGLKADWNEIEGAPIDTLINSLSAGCPFTTPEKQALLEARTLQDRCSALIALLVMERPGQGGGYVQ
jgi:uncharacterized protein